MPTLGTFIPYEFLTHQKRVMRLYKKILRDIQSWTALGYQQRISMVLMRAEFEKNRNIKDPIKARMLVKEAEDKFNYIKHPVPITYPDSFGGVAFERREGAHVPDSVLDYWHPLEKAQYPDYFARRELRKKEFVEWYNNKYGKPKFEQVN